MLHLNVVMHKTDAHLRKQTWPAKITVWIFSIEIIGLIFLRVTSCALHLVINLTEELDSYFE